MIKLIIIFGIIFLMCVFNFVTKYIMMSKERKLIRNIKTREDQLAAVAYTKKRTDTITIGLVISVLLLLIASALPL